MEETMTVQQLGQALNQLLDAYEDLQNKNNDLKKELEQTQAKNEELEEKVKYLSSTTTEQNTEMDAMINRIESILGGSVLSSDMTQSNIEQQSKEELGDQELETTKQPDSTNETNDIPTQESYEEQEIKKDKDQDQPDLGRMQALLNGFNN